MTQAPSTTPENESSQVAAKAGDTPLCDFGRHTGEPYSRIPDSYLQWMLTTNHSRADLARAELARRTSSKMIEVSGQAIDGLSKHCLHIWDQTRFTAEGLHEWARREGRAALDAGVRDHDGRHHHLGVVWLFDLEGQQPILVSAWAEKSRSAVDWSDRVRAGALRHEKSLKVGRGKL